MNLYCFSIILSVSLPCFCFPVCLPQRLVLHHLCQLRSGKQCLFTLCIPPILPMASHSLQLLSDIFFSFVTLIRAIKMVFYSSSASSYSFALLMLFLYICVDIFYREEVRSVLWRRTCYQRMSLLFWKCIGRNFKLMTPHSVFFSVENRSRVILALLKSESILIFLFNSDWLLSVEKGVGRKGQGTSLVLLSRHRI